jgi:hypothetical protein
VNDGIRYQAGDADGNAVLRLALLESWGSRCYWCRAPKDFADVEIDHVIPHTVKPDALDELLREHLTSATREQFELHAASNLGPICRPCNNEKSNLNLIETGKVTTKLVKACGLRKQVEKRVRSFESSNTVTKAVLAVSMADLSELGSKRALVDFGPLVVHRLAMLAPAILTQYSVSHELWDPHADNSPDTQVVLDEAGRRTRVILEDFYGMDFDEALLAAISALKKEIGERLQEDIASEFRRYGHLYPDVGDPAGRLLIEVNNLIFGRPDAFTIHGIFDVDMSSGVLVHSDHDSGTGLLQGDAAAHGRFSISFSPDDTDSTRADVGDPVIDDWQAGPAPW